MKLLFGVKFIKLIVQLTVAFDQAKTTNLQ